MRWRAARPWYRAVRHPVRVCRLLVPSLLRLAYSQRVCLRLLRNRGKCMDILGLSLRRAMHVRFWILLPRCLDDPDRDHLSDFVLLHRRHYAANSVLHSGLLVSTGVWNGESGSHVSRILLLWWLVVAIFIHAYWGWFRR